MGILLSKRQSILLLERARVQLRDGVVVYAKAEGGTERYWNIPSANIALLLLGNGSSITQAAARALAEDSVMVALGFTGGGGTPLFMASQSEYRPTEHLHRWLEFWPDPARRLRVARFLQEQRIANLEKAWDEGPVSRSFVTADLDEASKRFRAALTRARSVDELMGFEGRYAAKVYQAAASATNVYWDGRKPGDEDGGKVNRFLDQGNYLAYGLASVVLWALGIPPSLPVTHGQSRRGGLVFDLADTVKDSWILLRAFRDAAQGCDAKTFRDNCIEDAETLRILPRLFEIMEQAIAEGTRA